jgi:hypothetical protein
MRKAFTILVMSLVLVFGLWGYSQSENRPTPSPELPGGITPTDDHPWGGDQGHGGVTGGTTGGLTKGKGTTVSFSTGNYFLDLIMNQAMTSNSVQKVISNHFKARVTTTGTTGTTNATPASSTKGTSAN